MDLQLIAMTDCDLSQAAVVLNKGFADYFVKIELNAATLTHMAAQEGIQLGDSRVVKRGDEFLAAGLVARRGWSSRLAGMAVVPEARGQGVGKFLTTRLIVESVQRGERRMELEVIEANTPAVSLYEKAGFRTLRRLLSYSAPEQVEGKKADLTEIDIREAANAVTKFGLPDLPWQVSGESVAHVGPPSRAFRLHAASAVVSDVSAPGIAIRSIVVEPQGRGQGQAKRLLRALMAEFPGKGWAVPALCPEEIGPVFESAGFGPGDLSQFHMVKEWK
jgi:ribosomal protein S18 acetylase RimI-like enzyme